MQGTLELKQISGFGKLLNAYLHHDHPTLPLPAAADEKTLRELIASRRDFVHRELLQQVITEQYNGLTTSAAVKENIALIPDKNTFCITTGHQLTLVGGPLFVTYKVLTTVLLARQYKKLLPDHHFVPVFWLATEDHDKEEINHFAFRGETFTWETAQTGAVGRFYCEGILPLLEKFRHEFPGLQEELLSLFEKAYSLAHLADATRYLANELFGKYGVVVIDADHAGLKKIFLPVAEKEIHEKFVHQAVVQQNEMIEKAGFEPAIRPREINLFLHIRNDRKRLEVEGDQVRLADGSHQWNKKEFIDFIRQNPEDISPNVLLRPVYQEMILPNLAYIGGPAEIEYWLQLDRVFDALQIKIPQRVLRICATVIPATDAEKIEKTGVAIGHFLDDEDKLTRHFLEHIAGETLDFTSESAALEKIFEQLAHKARNIDVTLEPAVMAEKARQEKALENIFGRIRKAEKSRHEVEINRLKKLRNVLLPSGKLQERTFTLLDIPEKDLGRFTDRVPELSPNVMNFVVL
jgi:bacillithiol biosynthesis cysteine-adding enzyme BshC